MNKKLSLKENLDRYEARFRKLKGARAVERKYEALTAENDHSIASLLMAVHYGTAKDVERVKELIFLEGQQPAPNPSSMERIKMTSEFHRKHGEQLRMANFQYRDGHNYKYDFKAPLPEGIRLKIGEDIEYSQLGITRTRFHRDVINSPYNRESDHPFVTYYGKVKES